MTTRPRLYMDACCFIDLVKDKRGRRLAQADDEQSRRLNDCWHLAQLCDASRNSDVELVTSVLTLGECLHVSDDGRVDAETRNLIERLLSSGDVVELIEADVFVAEQARLLWWDHDIRVKGADAIHIATAIDQKCLEFLTTDRRVHQEGKKFQMAVPALAQLGLSVVTGSGTLHLPDEYRHADFFRG